MNNLVTTCVDALVGVYPVSWHLNKNEKAFFLYIMYSVQNWSPVMNFAKKPDYHILHLFFQQIWKARTTKKVQLGVLVQRPMLTRRPQCCASASWMPSSLTHPWSSWYGPSSPSVSTTAARACSPHWSLNWGLCSICLCGDSHFILAAPPWASPYWVSATTTSCHRLPVTELCLAGRSWVWPCSLQVRAGSRSAPTACCRAWVQEGPGLKESVVYSNGVSAIAWPYSLVSHSSRVSSTSLCSWEEVAILCWLKGLWELGRFSASPMWSGT